MPNPNVLTPPPKQRHRLPPNPHRTARLLNAVEVLSVESRLLSAEDRAMVICQLSKLRSLFDLL